MQEFVKAGIFAICTVGEPGLQGAGITGRHGIGVKAPIAAEVAAATCGFASDWHMAKGGMFTFGILSIMLAAGAPAVTLFFGKTDSAEGAIPKLHVIIAPLTT